MIIQSIRWRDQAVKELIARFKDAHSFSIKEQEIFRLAFKQGWGECYSVLEFQSWIKPNMPSQ